jgi:hypothetical protein
MNRRSLLPALLAIALGVSLPAAEVRTVRLAAMEGNFRLQTARFSLGPTVVADKDASVRLARSVLVSDEMGSGDFRQTESLGDRAQAKKVFRLDAADVQGAELFLFGEARTIAVNGKRLEKSEPLVSTGWTRTKVPPGYLQAGDNEVVLSGGGGVLFEPGRGRGRSFKSSDGGKTWAADELGAKNAQTGEYVVRLRVSRYAPRGSATSAVLDLWSSEGLSVPGKLRRIKGLGDLGKGQPEGTHVHAWLRTGTTPSPDGKNWTAWRELQQDYTPDAAGAAHRWVQLKIDLSTTHPQFTPRLHTVGLEYERDLDAARLDAARGARVTRAKEEDRATATSSVPFVYQEPSPRLELLREKYQLDKVIAPGKTEMEQLMLLRYWVRNQCHRGWASHPALWIPPWDSLLILDSRDRPDCLVMCTHYACIFTQCCLALGWNSRHCILDHHCVSEVWVDQHRKWVMMDTGNSAERADVGLHFERQGVPLSARELQQVHRTGKTEGITVCFTPARLAKQIASLCRPAPPPKTKQSPRPDTIPLAELKNYPVCQLDNYRRYAFPPRNNYLASLYPGEPEHGFSNYYHDGYCWVGDSPDDPLTAPEYSWHLTPDRPQDIDWGLNWVKCHLSQSAKAGEVQVDVETFTPNLARLEKAGQAAGKEAWQPTPARFTWSLKPGRNVLAVRSVNHWGRTGQPSRIEVEWKPR